MIQTSYFAYYHGPDAVSIAIDQPKFYDWPTFEPLQPNRDLYWEYKKGVIDKEEFDASYNRALALLDPKWVYDTLKGRTLLTWERDPSQSHRKLVADWLTANGFECREYKKPITIDFDSFSHEKQTCLYCIYGKFRYEVPLRLMCNCEESKNYHRATRNPHRATCSHWRSKY